MEHLHHVMDILFLIILLTSYPLCTLTYRLRFRGDVSQHVIEDFDSADRPMISKRPTAFSLLTRHLMEIQMESEHFLDHMFKLFDLNDDNKIERGEFKTMLTLLIGRSSVTKLRYE